MVHLFAGLIALISAGSATPPERIVSLNVCTDQLLIALADRERISGVSYWAIDPGMSAYAPEAQGLKTVRGTAEEVISLRPDLVLAGTFSTRETVQILERLGHDVRTFAPVSTLGGIAENLRTLGTILGEEARAEELIADMTNRLAATKKEGRADAPLFATYEANGYSIGGGTLMADIATHAGYRTLGDELGFQGVRQINLETLLTARPDVISLGNRNEDAPALASEALKHPALRHLIGSAAAVDIPGNLTVCGTPRTVEAVERLYEARP